MTKLFSEKTSLETLYYIAYIMRTTLKKLTTTTTARKHDEQLKELAKLETENTKYCNDGAK